MTMSTGGSIVRPSIAVDFHVAAGKRQGTRTFLEGIYPSNGSLDQEFAVHRILDRGQSDAGLINVHRFPSRGRMGRYLLGARRLERALRPDGWHFQYLLPLGLSRPAALTIHDVLPLTHPHLFTSGQRAYFRALMMRSIQRAKVITTGSHFSANAIATHASIDERTIHVTGYGVQPDLFQPHPLASDSETLRSMGIPEQYFLCVGRIERRKNHAAAFAAFARLVGSNRTALVVVGSPEKTGPDLGKLAQSHGVLGRTRHLANVAPRGLAVLYRNAVALIAPSLAEGFDLPVIEALASGCPVIASAIPPHEEVLAGHGLLFNPSSVEDLRRHLQEVLDERPKELVRRGLRRAQDFSWQAAQTRIAKAFRELLEAPLRP
ncbi:MAG TPA: glycosyltransferase family 1 protein [Candidatus Thermoplasmatota archaeon]|nr:glycosyltransferase family 1 protein [Candidatus Thermoplasmatota archaeon]